MLQLAREIESRFSCSDVSADHIQVVAGSFEGLLGVMVRDESGVIIEGHVPLPPETVEDGQQAGVFLVNARPDEFYDRDVMPRLTSSAEGVAKH